MGRRWLLKLAGGTAALTAVATLVPPAAFAMSNVETASQDIPPVARLRPTRLQFALGSQPGLQNVRLAVADREYPLVAHDATSREQLRAEGGVWARADLSSSTHHVEGATLPVDRSMLLLVTGTRNGTDSVVALHYHIPADASAAAAAAAQAVSGEPGGPVSTERLRRLGLSAADVHSADDVAQLDGVMDPSRSRRRSRCPGCLAG
jgi:hypothetical protein